MFACSYAHFFAHYITTQPVELSPNCLVSQICISAIANIKLLVSEQIYIFVKISIWVVILSDAVHFWRNLKNAQEKGELDELNHI